MKKTVYFLIFLLLSCNSKVQELPIYGRKKIIKKKINGVLKTDTIDHTVSDFKFINQDGDSISNNTFQNDVYLADFFFTTCPTICPIMKSNLLKIYDHFENQNNYPKISLPIVHCEADFFRSCRELADEFGVRIHSHVAESKMQAVVGQTVFGCSLTEYLDQLNVIYIESLTGWIIKLLS